MAQFRPVVSSLGTFDGRISLREAVATDMVTVSKRYTMSWQGAWGPMTCKIIYTKIK